MSQQSNSLTPVNPAIKRSQYTVKTVEGPLLNYTLSTVCPACNHPTIRRACKVRCQQCGFMWDCSEL